MRLLKSLIYQLIEAFQTIKKKGVRAGVSKLGKMLVRIFYTRLELVVLAKPITENDDPTPEPPLGLVIRQLKQKEDLVLFDPFLDPKDAARTRQVFDYGDIAMIALQDKQLAGWGWITYKIDPETNRVHIPLGSGDASLYNLFVVPAYRGQGIGEQLVACRLQLLREQDYKRSVISCVKGNIPALKVAQKTGYVSIGESCHTRFLFWDRLKYTPYTSPGKKNV